MGDPVQSCNYHFVEDARLLCVQAIVLERCLDVLHVLGVGHVLLDLLPDEPAAHAVCGAAMSIDDEKEQHRSVSTTGARVNTRLSVNCTPS